MEAARNFAVEAARMAHNTRCHGVLVLEMVGISPITDFNIIATGTSARQMRSVCDDIDELAKTMGFPSFHRSGYEGETWIAVDYVDVVLHLFNPDARSYYDAISLGIDFTARDLQSKCKAKGLPWEVAKAFDGSAAIGEFVAVPDEPEYGFTLLVNGELRQDGNTRDMLNGCDALIHHVSRYFTLAPGDLVYTGTPAGVGPVAVGDVLEGFLGDRRLLVCEVRNDPGVGRIH